MSEKVRVRSLVRSKGDFWRRLHSDSGLIKIPPIPLSAIAFTRLSKSWPWTGFHVNLAGSTRHPHVFTSSTNYPPPNHFKNIYIFQKKIKSALKSWSFLKSKIFNFVRSGLITTERFFWDLSAGINPKIN